MSQPTQEQQELVNKAIIGLRKQGVPSINNRGECMYRGPGGLACVAGHALPDSEYHPYMDGLAPDEDGFVFFYTPNNIPFFIKMDVASVMLELQRVHDYWARDRKRNPFPEFLFRRVCVDFGYQYPEQDI